MATPTESEFVVRVPPRDDSKKFHVMKFNASYNQEMSKWTNARMVRENNQKIVQSNIPTDDDPKFGAGSVFGKDVKEELRLKKLGINRKKYDPDAQPWLMRLNGKGGRKFKGIREGGVSENTSYYVFTHGKDGAFEAYPVSEWYNFTPIMRYSTRSLCPPGLTCLISAGTRLWTLTRRRRGTPSAGRSLTSGP